MATARKTAAKKVTSKTTALKKAAAKKKANNYLTKRILKSAATAGFTRAAAKTMSIMGQNVIAKNGWVVRIYADGHIEQISKIDNNHSKIALD